MNLFTKTGKMALGSRLRLLTTKVTDDAANIYGLYGIDLSPKWFPVFFVLSQQDNMTITDIATEIEHSQPSVSKIVKEMIQAGLIAERQNKLDKRSTIIALIDKGKEIGEKIKDQYIDVDAAIDSMIAESAHNLWKAIEEWEYLLEQKSLYRRVLEHKKKRETNHVRIIPFDPSYKQAFKTLNEEWISTYFKLEESDHKALNNPKTHILNRGGHILVALYRNEPLGVCALIKMDDPDYDFELAKMAVSPRAQGKNIGWLLGTHIIDLAKSLGASKLYLESNTTLTPAINLYHKLGFKKVFGRTSPYKRSDIQMELDLKRDM